MPSPDLNPYATPDSLRLITIDSPASVPTDIFRQGPLLIIPRRSIGSLPRATCFKCGQPAVKELERTLFWHPPSYYLLIILVIVPYILVAPFATRETTVPIGLCARHADQRQALVTAAWASLLSALFLIGSAFRLRSGDLFPRPLGWGLLILAITLALFYAASHFLVRAKRITRTESTLTGAGEAYLRQFSRPPAPRAPTPF